MKKLFIIHFIIFPLTVVFGQWQEYRQPITSQKYVNTQGGLRLRDQPSINGRVFATIPYDGMVVLFGEYSNEVVIDNIQGKWAKVFYDNFIGWVFDGYLSDRNSFGAITYITRGYLFDNIKREFMLEELLPSEPLPFKGARIIINSSSTSIETFRGFKIGESIEELMKIYPSAKKNEMSFPYDGYRPHYYWTISLLLGDWTVCYFRIMFYYNNRNNIYEITMYNDWVDLSAYSP
jgi:hypothetical protein